MPTVVLLHGVQSSRATWWRIAPALEKAGWQVLALDLAGHGDRADSPAPTLDAMAGDVVDQLRDRSDLADLDLIAGHSLGAVVALRLCDPLRPGPRLPHPPRGVLVEDPPGLAGIDPTAIAVGVQAAAARAAADPDREIENILRSEPRWSRTDAEQAVAGRRAMNLAAVVSFLETNHWDLPALVAACPARLLLLAATAPGTALLDPDRRQVLQLLGADQVVVIDGGHSLHREEPDQWLAALTGFAHSLGLAPTI